MFRAGSVDWSWEQKWPRAHEHVWFQYPFISLPTCPAPGALPGCKDHQGEKTEWDPCPQGVWLLPVGDSGQADLTRIISDCAVEETSKVEWGQARGQAKFNQEILQAHWEKGAIELDLKDGNRKLQGQKLALEPRGKSARVPRVSKETVVPGTGMEGRENLGLGFLCPRNNSRKP